MKTNDDLFTLIKSLTKSEKRYFKVFASKVQCDDTTGYLEVFDLLDGMEHYNDALVRSNLGQRILRHLPQTKHYLYRIILRALNQYHASASPEIQLNELIQGAQRLYDKGLYDQCEKLLQKGRKLAVKNDSRIHLLQISTLEYHLAMTVADANAAQTRLESVFNSLDGVTEGLSFRYRFWRRVAEANIMEIRSGNLKDEGYVAECGRLLHDPQLAEAEHSTDPVVKFYHLSIRARCLNAIGRHDEGYRLEKRTLAFVESEPSLRSNVPGCYLPALHNLCASAHNLRRFDQFDSYYAQLRDALEEVRATNPHYSDFPIRLLKMGALMARGNFIEAMEEGTGIEEMLTRGSDTLRTGLATHFTYLMAYGSLGMGEPAGALRWINAIMSDRSASSHLELHCCARILNLLAHYELGNLENLTSYIGSAIRFLTKRKRLHRFETIAIDLVRKLLDARDGEERHRVLMEIRERLLPLYESESDMQMRMNLDLLAWIDAQLEGKRLMEIVARNHTHACAIGICAHAIRTAAA